MLTKLIIREVECDQINNWHKCKREYPCISNKYLFKSKELAKKVFDYSKSVFPNFGVVLNKNKEVLGKLTFDQWYEIVCWHVHIPEFDEYINWD